MSRVSNPGKEKIVPFSKTSTPAVGPIEPPDQRVFDIFSRGNAAGGRGVDYLLLFIDEVQNE